ncbi:Uncharacterized protein QTN25_000352 [Entamoeba marina]
MSHFNTHDLMVIVYHIPSILIAKNFLLINKHCFRALQSLRVNPCYSIPSVINSITGVPEPQTIQKALNDELTLFPQLVCLRLTEQHFPFKYIIPKSIKFISLPKNVTFSHLELIPDNKVYRLYHSVINKHDTFSLKNFTNLKVLYLSVVYAKFVLNILGTLRSKLQLLLITTKFIDESTIKTLDYVRCEKIIICCEMGHIVNKLYHNNQLPEKIKITTNIWKETLHQDIFIYSTNQMNITLCKSLNDVHSSSFKIINKYFPFNVSLRSNIKNSKFDLSHMTSIQNLSGNISNCTLPTTLTSLSTNTELTQNLPNLQVLSLKNYCIISSLLTVLTKLELSNCTKCVNFEHLINLRNLSLDNMTFSLSQSLTTLTCLQAQKVVIKQSLTSLKLLKQLELINCKYINNLHDFYPTQLTLLILESKLLSPVHGLKKLVLINQIISTSKFNIFDNFHHLQSLCLDSIQLNCLGKITTSLQSLHMENIELKERIDLHSNSKLTHVCLVDCTQSTFLFPTCLQALQLCDFNIKTIPTFLNLKSIHLNSLQLSNVSGFNILQNISTTIKSIYYDEPSSSFVNAYLSSYPLTNFN